MNYIVHRNNYKLKKSFFEPFLDIFWFIPSDIIQRGVEANIWDITNFKRPILEIGTGNGRLTRLIFKKVKNIDVGIDIEKENIEEASSNKIYDKVLHTSAEKMLLNDKAFNTVIANSTFEHIKNDFKAVSEVSRVLKKGGLFFLTVPNQNLTKWILEYENSIKKNDNARGNLRTFDKRANHLHYHTLEEWEKCFKKNKMKIIFYRYYFKRDTAVFWYRIFKIFTHKFNKVELWSYLSSKKYNVILPKRIIKFLIKIIIKKHFGNEFFSDQPNGAQLFMVVKRL